MRDNGCSVRDVDRQWRLRRRPVCYTPQPTVPLRSARVGLIQPPLLILEAML
jgi:hypothetical protein